MNTTNEMQLYRLIYYSQSALHVSGDVFAYHQEHFTVFTASAYMDELEMSSNSSMTPAGSDICVHYQML